MSASHGFHNLREELFFLLGLKMRVCNTPKAPLPRWKSILQDFRSNGIDASPFLPKRRILHSLNPVPCIITPFSTRLIYYAVSFRSSIINYNLIFFSDRFRKFIYGTARSLYQLPGAAVFILRSIEKVCLKQH